MGEASILNEPVDVEFPALEELARQVDEILGADADYAQTARWMREHRQLYLAGIFGPRDAGDCWRAGWTQVGTAGWNGTPDYYASGKSPNEALWRSMWLALVYNPAAAGRLPESGPERG